MTRHIQAYAIPGIIRKEILSMETIIKVVMSYFNEQTPLEQLGRKRKHATIKHTCAYLIRRNTGASLIDVARRFRKDHTTIIYSISCIEGFLNIKDEQTTRDIAELTRILNN